jgi:hypothetical protein
VSVDLSGLTSLTLCAIVCALAALSVVYVWHLSELLNNIRSKLEAFDHLWWGKLLTCPYCIGYWIVLALWSSLWLNDDLPKTGAVLRCLGGLCSIGLFNLAWSDFVQRWKPL